MPVIQGPLVRLEPFQDGHITLAYLSWLNDRELMRYSNQRFHSHTLESSHAYLKSFAGSPNFFWSVHRCFDNLQVGTMTAYIEPEHAVADVGILIGHRAARGVGFGCAAWGLAMDFLFRQQHIRKVTGGASALNLPMMKIFHRWHMKLEGVRREQELVDGQPADVMLFGTLLREWLAVAPTALAAVLEC